MGGEDFVSLSGRQLDELRPGSQPAAQAVAVTTRPAHVNRSNR